MFGHFAFCARKAAEQAVGEKDMFRNGIADARPMPNDCKIAQVYFNVATTRLPFRELHQKGAWTIAAKRLCCKKPLERFFRAVFENRLFWVRR